MGRWCSVRAGCCCCIRTGSEKGSGSTLICKDHNSISLHTSKIIQYKWFHYLSLSTTPEDVAIMEPNSST